MSLHQQPAGQQEIPGEGQSRARIDEHQVIGVMPGRGDQLDLAVAQLEMCAAIGPVLQAEVLAHGLALHGHHRGRRQCGKGRIAGPVILVAM